MADGTIAVTEGAGKNLDTEQLTVAATTVQRERVQVAGAADVAIAAVKNADPTTEYGLVTRNLPSGIQNVNVTQQALVTNRLASATLGALNAAVTIDASGAGTIGWECGAGLTGTLLFEATVDDSVWFTVDMVTVGGLSMLQTLNTGGSAARGQFLGLGYSQVRMRVSAYTSGSTIGKLVASAGTSVVKSPTGTGGSALQVQGTGSHDFAVVGNPLQTAGYASAAAPADVTDGDLVRFWALRNGAQAVNLTAAGALIPGDATNGLDIDVTRMPVDAAAAEVQGTVADAVADAQNPVGIGLTARQTNRTAVADGNRVRAIADDMGRQVVVVGQVRDLVSHQHTQIASSSAETTIVTAVASEFHDLVMLVLTNQTATAVNVTIKDATAGTTRMIVALAANGGAVLPFPVPLPQLAAVNNNWTATLSSAAVTVNILAQFIKNV